MLRPWPVVMLMAAITGCGLPRDPDGTSSRIASTHELRVGVTANGKWVDASGSEPQGVEPDLVRHFAERLGARVAWTVASEAVLAQSLKRHELDLAIGGFDAKTPWKSVAGVSLPFAEIDGKKHVFLAAPGENEFMLRLDADLTERMRASKGQGA